MNLLNQLITITVLILLVRLERENFQIDLVLTNINLLKFFISAPCVQEITVIYEGTIDIQDDVMGIYVQVKKRSGLSWKAMPTEREKFFSMFEVDLLFPVDLRNFSR